jgi:TRAP-type C4-dicarboxylate transport system substrate-binding protein
LLHALKDFGTNGGGIPAGKERYRFEACRSGPVNINIGGCIGSGGVVYVKKILSLAMLFLFVVMSCGMADAATRLDANSVWPPKNHQTKALEKFAELVDEKTSGEVEIVVHAGGALGYKGPELLRAVRDGLIPVSDMLTSGVAGDEPLFGIPTLPFLVRGFDEGRLLSEICRPYFDKVAEEKWNQKILYIAPWPAAGLWTQKEIHSVEDMKGLKTRTYDKNGALVMKAVGATPYPLPFSEVYSSLATGLIDSVLTSTPTAVDAKFWEVLKYFHRFDVTMATDLHTINLDTFNSLSEKEQAALVEAGKEVEKYMWDMVAELDKEQEAISNENGIVSVPVTDEILDELTEVTKEIRANWLAEAPPEAREIVDKFLEEVGRK